MRDPLGHSEAVSWRAWPNTEGASKPTDLGLFTGRARTNYPQSSGSLNEIIELCQHVEQRWIADQLDLERAPVLTKSLHYLDEGSEHRVYLDPDSGKIIKVTLPDVYGDFYFLEDGRVNQAACPPGQYLRRMQLISEIFGFEAVPVGYTAKQQIVTRHPFVQGDACSQKEVDSFLFQAGLQPVKQQCFLWRITDSAGSELWIGDARDENFIRTAGGLVPVDLRAWYPEP